MFTIEAPVETVNPGNPHAVLTVKHEGRAWLAVLARERRPRVAPSRRSHLARHLDAGAHRGAHDRLSWSPHVWPGGVGSPMG